jgi:hypothetical protein
MLAPQPGPSMMRTKATTVELATQAPVAGEPLRFQRISGAAFICCGLALTVAWTCLLGYGLVTLIGRVF